MFKGNLGYLSQPSLKQTSKFLIPGPLYSQDPDVYRLGKDKGCPSKGGFLNNR